MLFIPVGDNIGEMYKNNDIESLTTVINKENTITSKIRFLNNITASNSDIENKTIEETVLLNMFKRACDISYSIYEIHTSHIGSSMQLLRSLYEIGVLIRILSESTEDDLSLFRELGHRISDSAIMEEYDLYNLNKGAEFYDLKLKYRDRGTPRDKTMYKSYDWAKPFFSERELKRLNTSYSPSFRDLVFKSGVTDSMWKNNISVYEDASSIIHYSGITQKVIDNQTSAAINTHLSVFIRAIVIDYLIVVENLCHSIEKDNYRKLETFAKKMRLLITKDWE